MATGGFDLEMARGDFGVDAASEVWPPQLGDYARIRQSGALGEIIDVACRGTDSRYVLNVFTAEAALPSEYHLDDLTPAWPTDWT